MPKTGWIVIIIIIIIAIGGIWWWSSSSNSMPSPADTAVTTNTAPDVSQTAPTPDQNAADASSTANPSSANAAPMTATVTYDGNSFSPSTVTIAQGGTVTFTDNAGQMWVASNPHPTHEGYDGTTRTQHCAAGYTGATPFDECSPGSSFSFTFNKTGTFGYHDHLNHGATGTINVVSAQ